MTIIQQYQSDGDFSRLPLPAFAYRELPAYHGTELSRLNENAEYAEKQMKATTEEQRLENLKERLKRKFEAIKRSQK